MARSAAAALNPSENRASSAGSNSNSAFRNADESLDLSVSPNKFKQEENLKDCDSDSMPNNFPVFKYFVGQD